MIDIDAFTKPNIKEIRFHKTLPIRKIPDQENVLKIEAIKKAEWIA